jgi:hypothetical protein
VERQGRCGPCANEYDLRRGNASERGYGSEHQRRRKALLRKYIGTLCPKCGKRLEKWQRLEAHHSTPLYQDASAVADELVHAECNPKGRSPENVGR